MRTLPEERGWSKNQEVWSMETGDRKSCLLFSELSMTSLSKMHHPLKEYSTIDKPLGKRNAYNLFYKFHRHLLLQSIELESKSELCNRNDNSKNSDNNKVCLPPNHWSKSISLVKEWKSNTVRLSDFSSFEQFMMHVLDIDLESDINYLRKERRNHTKTHGLMNLKKMATTIGQLWKLKNCETLKIFQYFADLDAKRYEKDMKIYFSYVSKTSPVERKFFSKRLPEFSSDEVAFLSELFCPRARSNKTKN